MLSSSRNRMPFPEVGKNSGGSHRETPSAATGSPRRSVGASWLRRRSRSARPWRPAVCATMLDLPMPGGPQIITERVRRAEMIFESVDSSSMGDIGGVGFPRGARDGCNILAHAPVTRP